MKKHIYLTGFMGAGKSKIGRLLAERLALPFFDSDGLIEERSGQIIRALFETKGEAYFRQLETQVIREIAAMEYPAVVALGGGALLSETNRQSLRKSGLIIYIQSSAQAIFERVKQTDKRPLLNIKRDEHHEERLMQTITELLKQREPLYRQADITLQRDGMEADVIAERLVALIDERWMDV